MNAEQLVTLGAQDGEPGLFIRFDPGFGLNVFIGHRRVTYDDCFRPVGIQVEEIGMSIAGWERLCSLVDEWRAR